MVINPLSSDLNAMRQTLLFSGLEVIAHNLNRQAGDLRLFEMGNVYRYEPKGEGDPVNNLESYSERMHLAMFMVGKGTQYWRNTAGAGHFFALKGYVELLLRRMGMDINVLDYEPAPADIFSEGMVCRVPSSGKVLLMFGTVAPARLRQFDIKQPVFAAEIDWQLLLKHYLKSKVLYKELPLYPEVKRNVTFADIRKAAFAAERKLLRKVVLFDVYRGDKIPAGKKQYAVSLTLQDYDKTLTDKYVDQTVNRILGALSHQFGAVLR